MKKDKKQSRYRFLGRYRDCRRKFANCQTGFLVQMQSRFGAEMVSWGFHASGCLVGVHGGQAWPEHHLGTNASRLASYALPSSCFRRQFLHERPHHRLPFLTYPSHSRRNWPPVLPFATTTTVRASRPLTLQIPPDFSSGFTFVPSLSLSLSSTFYSLSISISHPHFVLHPSQGSAFPREVDSGSLDPELPELMSRWSGRLQIPECTRIANLAQWVLLLQDALMGAEQLCCDTL